MHVRVNTKHMLLAPHRHKHSGFTLIELIVGMLVFAVAMAALTNIFMPQVRKGIDPIWQVRAVTLAQSLSTEIRAKAFDENSGFGGVNGPCGDTLSCTQSAALGPDTVLGVPESRDAYDDVDDYHGMLLQGSDIASSLGISTNFSGLDVYEGFSAAVSVVYDNNADGVNDDDLDADDSLDTGTYTGNRKLITIAVQTPSGDTMYFAMYRDNY
ncbi:prepilin-type N-terminal cleavage/methylation domain-containing protein [Glaciecola siphonariae]|uniref:Prepilin-type N-terminal cleavage/methylation domain-containing protein n=1 Tax=Glaciecola siphonariae TaxID=521012 RepID=A0ABV9LX04_9ALTE